MKWNVGTKLGIGFGLSLLVFVVVGIISYHSTEQLIYASDWRQHSYEVLANLAQSLASLTDVETGQRGYVLTGDQAYLEPYQSGSDKVLQVIQNLKRLTADNAAQQERLERLDPLVNDRLVAAREIIDIRRTNSEPAAVEIIKTGRDKRTMDQIRQIIADMQAEEETLLKTRSEESQQNAVQTKVVIVAGTIIALVLASLAGLIITRNISAPLKELTIVADRITVGDLNSKVAINGRSDEVGTLARAFGQMTHSLREMAKAAEQIASGDLRSAIKPQSNEDLLGVAFARMSENLRRQISGIIEGANVLGSSASEIVASTTQLASSAAESATAVSQTSTTVEEVRQTAQLTTQKAKAVADTAQKTAQISQTGRKSAEEAASGMNRIRQQMEGIAASMVRLNEQSQTIGQIIATVEDLAAQSNLLAVNAAIEAAKAGEHGKGFNVVAQEVKSLAEQSRQATMQVRTILSDIQKASASAMMATEQGTRAVESGEKQAGNVDQCIQALAGSVTEAAQAATQIAASSQQQLVGMDQVGAAISNIRQASSQNVASAKQLETAARNLNELGQRLKGIVEQYRV